MTAFDLYNIWCLPLPAFTLASPGLSLEVDVGPPLLQSQEHFPLLSLLPFPSPVLLIYLDIPVFFLYK